MFSFFIIVQSDILPRSFLIIMLIIMFCQPPFAYWSIYLLLFCFIFNSVLFFNSLCLCMFMCYKCICILNVCIMLFQSQNIAHFNFCFMLICSKIQGEYFSTLINVILCNTLLCIINVFIVVCNVFYIYNITMFVL